MPPDGLPLAGANRKRKSSNVETLAARLASGAAGELGGARASVRRDEMMRNIMLGPYPLEAGHETSTDCGLSHPSRVAFNAGDCANCEERPSAHGAHRRSFITWDPNLGHYRIWRFVPLLAQEKHDGVGRFVGDTFIEEYAFEGSGARKQVLRNRISKWQNGGLRIVNEIESGNGSIALRGVIVATPKK